MQKTNQYQNGVIGIISRARNVNPEIGNYVEHFINDNFRIVVRLSNGRMQIPLEYAQDQETSPESIDNGIITRITNSFQNNNPQTQRIETKVEPPPTTQKKSWWTILLELLGINK